MSQSVQTILNINGIANGSPYSTQEPTIVFDNLPFSLWGAMSTASTVTGKVVGIANPQQYQVALFALESKTQILGNTSWLASVGSDGTFSLSVQQSATIYCALLMTPTFAQSYFASTFPGGSGMVSTLPVPAEHPGDVLLMIGVPAGLNRSLVQPFSWSDPVIKPGDAFLQPAGLNRQLSPGSTNGLPDPSNPSQTHQLWTMLLEGNTPSMMSFRITTQNRDGTAGRGAFATGVYVYGQTMYLLAGAGPASGQPSGTTPIVVSQAIVNWQVLPPSMVQLGMALTILPEKILLAVDVVNVEPSVLGTFLKALYKVEFELLGLLFEML
ncbi:hypothetical protein LZ198_16480 [Myxococcus sp. K15C18031901]|uniref:hypothetical protein n=1 Tax=Myxococcus dinghuensis TaxID=2906761 RepID=UPI0020A7245F|nr:hypothetical protein [Myxococcus dinghuensis]MCP3100467.1 hypothetical protein [Myxococcus dinghuensis]